MNKICITCHILGECTTTTFEMLENDQGCGSWDLADDWLIRSRARAREVAGPAALRAMLNKSPRKPIRR